MFYTIFLTVIINITIIVIGYRIILSKLEKKIINKNVIDEVKQEINKIIINLNKTTTDNISLLEDRINKINKLLLLTDKKIESMSDEVVDLHTIKKQQINKMTEENFTYSPQKIVNQSQKIAENKNDDNVEIISIEKEIENLSINEKVVYLLEQGKTKKEIKKIVGLSSGELELLLNIEKSYTK